MNDSSEFSEHPQFTRRNFIALTALTAGALALRVEAAAAADVSTPPLGGLPARSHGISESAVKDAMARARRLVEQMTLEEKVTQVDNQASAIDRLGIPAYQYWREALHGVLDMGFTSFPLPLALAASWNPGLALRVYTAISDEARGSDNKTPAGLSFYSPSTLNLHRDPRWGRCEEAPGEDPCLASTMAVQMIRGMQGDDPNYLKTTACAKHFICNNTDNDRTAIDASVPARMFWEYYTRAYREAVVEGDVFTAMGAYSALNGVPCCASHFLMTDLLRGQWGFRGYVTSDCDAIQNIHDPHKFAANDIIGSAMGINAGCDLDCGGTYTNNLKAAVDQEVLGVAHLNNAVTRVLAVRHLLGLFDEPAKVPYKSIPASVVNSTEHQAVALDAARQSLVLLKNEGGFLPLNKAALKKVAVIGPMAGICNLGGYSGIPPHVVSPLRGISVSLIGLKNLHPVPADCMTGSSGPQLETLSQGGVHLGFIQNGSWVSFAENDFTGKTQFEARVSSATKGGHLEVHLDSQNGPLACAVDISATGGWESWVTVSAPLTGLTGEHEVYLTFSGGEGFLFNVESWQLNPVAPGSSSKTEPQVIFKMGCSVTGAKDDKAIQEAADAARDADVAIVVCGVNGDVDSEAHDRDDIILTGAQPDLIKAVFAANPKTVLVLSTNNTVAVNWEQQNLPAIICAIDAGQAQGTAIADVLLGSYNPGGKLPCTWYRSIDQLPPIHDYDLTKGRTYQYFEGDPLYHFGHGLSYTTFQFSDLHISAAELGPGATVDISATVANTGNMMGAEVAQLYITAPTVAVKRPLKQLAGFQRLELAPGMKQTVTFTLPYEQLPFWYWDEKSDKFVLEPGTAKIQIGNSSANILLTGDLTLKPQAGPLRHPDAVRTVAALASVQ